MDPKRCHYCNQEITDKDQLITASNWFRIRPFHYLCFEEVEKDSQTIRSIWTPINGLTGNIIFLIMLLVSLVVLITDVAGYIGNMIGVIALYPVLLRLLSFFIIESKIPNQQKRR